jgi:hypothetical protein
MMFISLKMDLDYKYYYKILNKVFNLRIIKISLKFKNFINL